MSAHAELYGAIEAGGTKFICAIGDATGEILTQARIEVRDAAATLADAVGFFRANVGRYGGIRAVGVGSFGPLELRRTAPHYGFITTTPKPGWRHTDLLGVLTRELQLPVSLDTDVNAAALAELHWGAGQGLDSLVYVTVGTGIGAGILHEGRPVHGLMHPEAGHIRVQRHPADTQFAGHCPYHGDCLEGLASGPAILARTGQSLERAAPDDPIWEIEGDYLGQLCAQLSLMHSPQRILLGGGVMQQLRLFPLIRARTLHWLADYLAAEELRAPQYILPPGLRDAAGIKGALLLAMPAARPGSGQLWPAPTH